MQLILDLINGSNIQFRTVVELDQDPDYGDRYTVTFYDRRYNHSEHGQRVASYLLETLLEDKDRLKTGLNLHGGVPDWYLGADEMLLFFRWVNQYDFPVD